MALSTAVASLRFVGLTVCLMACLPFFAILTGYENLQNPRKQLVQMIPGKEAPRESWIEGWGTDEASASAEPLPLSCYCFPLKSRSGSKKTD